MAFLSSLIVNITQHLYSKKGHTPKLAKPLDFMPDWTGDKKEPKKQSVEEMKGLLLGMAQEQNKKAEREKKLSNKPPRKRRSK